MCVFTNVCMSGYACYVCVCACEGLRLMSVPFVNTLCLIFETEYLTDSKLTDLAMLAGPQAPRIHPLPPCIVLGL